MQPENPHVQYVFFKNFKRVINFSDGGFSIISYALIQAIAGFILVALRYYAAGGHWHPDPDLSFVIVHSYIIRGLFGSAAYHISIEIAAFTVSIAQLSWLFMGFLLWWPGREFYRDELPIIDQTE